MLEIIGLIFGGGATGLFGSLVSRGFSFFEKKQDYKHELALQELHIQTRGMELESEEAIAGSVAAATIREASYLHDASYGVPSPKAATVLRFVRPVLTLLLLTLVAVIWATLTPEQEEMQLQIISTILYLATVAFTWWFGSRDTEKAKQ